MRHGRRCSTWSCQHTNLDPTPTSPTSGILIPVTTQAVLEIGLLIGGLIVTEQVFQYPGMGLLFLGALHAGDYAVLLPAVMAVAVAVFSMAVASRWWSVCRWRSWHQASAPSSASLPGTAVGSSTPH
ncbi:ABC transporter permease subunit [Candidatus Poriferisodalis sp.]|uniref:ABC transporter permease subunit n=1 Tax=Candidatus Poriferisodalis sp. TaxID=3101277 RepID=UPI003AF5280C